MDRTYVLVSKGRPVSEREQRFNLLKSEQEEEDNPCFNCGSPDYTVDAKVQTEAKTSPYIRQQDVSSAHIMIYSSADLYQELREVKDEIRTCLFCGLVTKDIIKGDWVEQLVGRKEFMNGTATNTTFDVGTSASNNTNYYTIGRKAYK